MLEYTPPPSVRVNLPHTTAAKQQDSTEEAQNALLALDTALDADEQLNCAPVDAHAVDASLLPATENPEKLEDYALLQGGEYVVESGEEVEVDSDSEDEELSFMRERDVALGQDQPGVEADRELEEIIMVGCSQSRNTE